jgi:hypothetical protein
VRAVWIPEPRNFTLEKQSKAGSHFPNWPTKSSLIPEHP